MHCWQKEMVDNKAGKYNINNSYLYVKEMVDNKAGKYNINNSYLSM